MLLLLLPWSWKLFGGPGSSEVVRISRIIVRGSKTHVHTYGCTDVHISWWTFFHLYSRYVLVGPIRSDIFICSLWKTRGLEKKVFSGLPCYTVGTGGQLKSNGQVLRYVLVHHGLNASKKVLCFFSSEKRKKYSPLGIELFVVIGEFRTVHLIFQFLKMPSLFFTGNLWYGFSGI